MVKMRFLLDILFGSSHMQSPLFMVEAEKKGTDNFELFLNPGMEVEPAYTIIDIPSFQKVIAIGKLQRLKKVGSPLYKGYLINLEPFDDFDVYYKAHFDAKARRNYRRQGKKLQNEIRPQKKIFHGDVDKTDFDLLFDQLKVFLEKRFEEKETHNYEIPLLPLYKEMFWELLPKRNAIIFSLFHKEMPLCIGIAFIQGKTLYLFNIAYNIEYSQYGLGNQLMIAIVEWCFDNNITQVDMGRGDFLHKRNWINSTYTYLQLNLFAPNNFFETVRAYASWMKNNIRFYLILFLKKLQVHQLAKVLFLWRYRTKNILMHQQ